MSEDGLDSQQTKAAWAAAKYAKWAVIVAAIGIIVNAAVIAVALLVPVYQRSFEIIDSQIRQKEQLKRAMLLTARFIENTASQMRLGGFSEDICRSDRMTKDHETYVSFMFDLNAEHEAIAALPAYSDSDAISELRGFADAISTAHRKALERATWRGLEPKSRVRACAEAWSDVEGLLSSARVTLMYMNEYYEEPVTRPFGVLNGEVYVPPKITVSSGKEFKFELDSLDLRIRNPAD